MATLALGSAGSEADMWRKLAENMRQRAIAARPGAGKDLLARIADQFEKAAERAVGAEPASALASEERH
ncbi:MAG: hypothetical protein V4530_17225 [Pseudomonadota bacterium]